MTQRDRYENLCPTLLAGVRESTLWSLGCHWWGQSPMPCPAEKTKSTSEIRGNIECNICQHLLISTFLFSLPSQSLDHVPTELTIRQNAIAGFTFTAYILLLPLTHTPNKSDVTHARHFMSYQK